MYFILFKLFMAQNHLSSSCEPVHEAKKISFNGINSASVHYAQCSQCVKKTNKQNNPLKL